MADLATIEDVEVRWRPLNQQEKVVAQSWLGDASASLRVAISDVDARAAADPDSYGRQVAAVVAMAVVRVLRGQARNDAADYATIFFSKSELASLETSGSSETSGLPVGSFPCAQAWPDPVQPCWPRYW